MTNAANRFNTAITATDETAPGVKSAEGRFKRLTHNTSRFARQSASEARRSGLGQTARAFGEVEKAAARAFGGRSVTAGVADRLGGIAQASRFAGSAMVRTAAQGGVLQTALGGVALAGAGVAGALLAAGVAGFKFVSGWANNGAQLGRLSQSLNLATRDLQAFQGMAERSGVSRDAMAGALGGIGSSIHAGIYGQNPEALAALNKLGIPIKRNADGTVDIKAMTLALADATSKIKDPYAQQHLASIFGFQEALPAFRRGGAAMSADMADVGRIGGIIPDADIARASRIQRELVIGKQMGAGLYNKAGAGVAGFSEGSINGIIDGGRRLGEGAGLFDRTVSNRFVPAVDRLANTSRFAPSWPGLSSLAARIEHQESRGRQSAVSSAGAIGVMQLMPDTARAAANRLGVPFDMKRLRTDEAYNRSLGQEELRHLMERYGGDELLAAAAYNAGPGAVDRWIRRFGDPRGGGISHEAFAAKIPFDETRDYVSKVGAVNGGQPVRLIHEFRGLPRGASVATRAEGSGDVSIGRAMPDGP